MKLTNKYKLPQTLMNLHELQREAYSRGDARMSVTQLINSSRILMLRKKYYEQIEEDISDRLWAILGTVVHNIMEQGADEEHLPEERLFAELEGWIISGGIDVQRIGNQVKIIDYKFTKAIKYQIRDFRDWERQLNCYAYLVRKTKDWQIEALEIVMFVRDFSYLQSKTKADYPPASCVCIDIPLWTEHEQEEYIRSRIIAHKEAMRLDAWGEPLPECTAEERWKRDDEWIVKKPTAKRATRVFKAEQDAKDWLNNNKNPNDYVLDIREDAPTRCIDNYCGVKDWCDQYQREKNKWE